MNMKQFIPQRSRQDTRTVIRYLEQPIRFGSSDFRQMQIVIRRFWRDTRACKCLFRKYFSGSKIKVWTSLDGMKLAATGRAVRLAWTERSGTELKCKARFWIGSGQHQRRHQSTSKQRTWRIYHVTTVLMPTRRSEDSYPRN